MYEVAFKVSYFKVFNLKVFKLKVFKLTASLINVFAFEFNNSRSPAQLC